MDNLKLGYGGTKTEMERLLADAEKISGVKYDINNLSDVYNAIHVVQKELGITGTTSKEAEQTFTGSFNAMKGALSNFLATLTLGDQASMSLTQALQGLVSTTINFVFNNALPMLLNVVTSLPMAIFMALEQSSGGAAMGYVNKLFSFLTTFITQKLPEMLNMGLTSVASFVTGLLNGMPKVISSIATLIQNIVTGITERLPQILESAKNLILTLVSGIINNIPSVIQSIVKVITSIVTTIIQNLPQILAMGVKLIVELAAGIIKQFPNLVSKIPGLVGKIVSGFASGIGSLASVGANLVKGLWNGIASVKDWILSKIRGFGNAILSSLKSFFGIKSPSRLMRDEVGQYLAEGIGVGFTNSMDSVVSDMQNSLPTAFDIAPTVRLNSSIGQAQISTASSRTGAEEENGIINALRNATINHITNLDGRVIAEEIYKMIDELLGNDSRLQARGI